MPWAPENSKVAHKVSHWTALLDAQLCAHHRPPSGHVRGEGVLCELCLSKAVKHGTIKAVGSLALSGGRDHRKTSSGQGARALREGRAEGPPPAQALLAKLNAERLTDGLRYRIEIHR